MNTVRLRLTALTLLFLVPVLAGSKPELPPSTDQPSADEHKAREELAKTFPGRIVFDSNRGKGFGIFITDVLTQKIEPLVDTDSHEMYPDISPDQKWVVYSSSESLDKHAESDIWIVPSSGGTPRKLASTATFPTFSSDGKAVYFERSRKQVMRLDLAGGQETEIFPKGNPIWKKAQIVKPRVSPDGKKVAFISQKPRRWSSWYVDLSTGAAQHVGPGCEPTWSNDGKRVAWVGGRDILERAGISAFEIATKQVSKVQDAGPPRGHEYFPTFVSNNRFLLYSAARENEHKPTTANYQLFAKDLQSGKVVRITFDPYTNRWGKLLMAPK